MLRPLIASAALSVLAAGAARAHAILPGQQVVQTVGQRAFARFQAVNGRRDVKEFVVEIFDMNWVPSRLAVASPDRLVVPAAGGEEHEMVARPFSVLVDLDGKASQQLRVCTKSVFAQSRLLVPTARMNSRSCVSLTVRSFAP